VSAPQAALEAFVQFGEGEERTLSVTLSDGDIVLDQPGGARIRLDRPTFEAIARLLARYDRAAALFAGAQA
jgi:hypothetical protein